MTRMFQRLLVAVVAGLTAFVVGFAEPAVTHAGAVYVYGGYQAPFVSPIPYYQYDYAAFVPVYTSAYYAPTYAPTYFPTNPVPYPYGYGITPVVPVSGYAPWPAVYGPYHSSLRYRYQIRY